MQSPAADGDEPIELLVVGGGTAGLIAAKTAASFGARVLLVERDPAPGGDCLWSGCVPSKALLSVARQVAEARRATAFGLEVSGSVQAAAVWQRVRGAVRQIAPVDSAAALRQAGVAVRRGAVTFLAPDRAGIDGESVRFIRAVLATGAGPAPADLPFDQPPLTSQTVWDLDDLPGRLLIVGGGSTGCELGQAFGRLGCAVTIVEMSPGLLPAEDPDAGVLLAQVLTSEGIELRLGRSLRSVHGGTATLDDGSTVAFDRWLSALGRRPRTSGLGLGAAGVDLDEAGAVRVDARLHTTNPRIWAAGDVTGGPFLTHRAGIHGSVVAANAVLGLRRTAQVDGWPRVTFTDPEVGSVGVTSSSEVIKNAGLRAVTMPHTQVDRAITDGDQGFTRLLLDRRRRIRGAVIVSGRAGETLGEAALAVQQGTRVPDLVGTTHAYPTLSDGFWNAAIMDYQAQLGRPPWRWITSGLRRWRLRDSD